jgi:hypothetical protein
METLTRDDGKPLGASDKECRVHQGHQCRAGAGACAAPIKEAKKLLA